ncbi:MAG: ankyrin repeat domain-containing protein [Wolbachia endosymbiont of Tetragnatha montana]|nr:ankyrin repeat domain-containing protein [Wolbachia endosymbiont of Tetragnatha montana]
MVVEDDREDVVELLLKNGANVNARDKNGMDSLCRAAVKGHYEVVELLLKNGANVNARDKNGLTPLCWAAKGGHDKVVKLLLEREVESFGALVLALRYGHSEVVNLLLADPNINVGCIDYKFLIEKKADKEKFVRKKVQDGKLFSKVEEAAEKMRIRGELGESLKKELENLLNSESEYGFKPSLNYSPSPPGCNNENMTIKIAIKAGGEVLQLLYDHAEKNIGVDSEIFKRLKYAKENPQPRSSFNDVSTPHNLAQAQVSIT